jgi:hypothetical protein
MVKPNKSIPLIVCGAAILAALALAGCGKKEQTKAEEKAAADKNIRSNVIVGEQVKAMDKAKAVEAEMAKATAKIGEAADAAVK